MSRSLSLLNRLPLLRRVLAAALGLLLSLSLVGQQLPCLHADAGTDTETVVASEMSASASHDLGDAHADAHGHQTAQAHQHAAPEPANAPAPHHDPAAPGCAQLMACGLAVTVASAATVRTTDAAIRDERPVGPELQYSSAEREIELPPPRG